MRARYDCIVFVYWCHLILENHANACCILYWRTRLHMSTLTFDVDFEAWAQQISAESQLVALKAGKAESEQIRLLLLVKHCDTSILRHSAKVGLGTTTANTLEKELKDIWIRNQAISWSDLNVSVLCYEDLVSFQTTVRRLSYLSHWSDELALDRLYMALASKESLCQLVKAQKFSTVQAAISWIQNLDMLPRSSLAAAKITGRSNTCFKCGKAGHWRRNCPLLRSKNEETATQRTPTAPRQ